MKTDMPDLVRHRVGRSRAIVMDNGKGLLGVGDSKPQFRLPSEARLPLSVPYGTAGR
jgi:hypothetical protein